MRPHIRASLMGLFLISSLSAQDSKELNLKGDVVWTDTGIDVKPGDELRISATGTLTYPKAAPTGPDGLSRSFKDLVRILPMNEAGRGALLVRFGDNDASRPYLAGASKTIKALVTARLFVGVNQGGNDQPEGSYTVTIARTAAPAPVAGSEVSTANITKVSQPQIDSLPARVTDATGNPGDRINFIIVGPEQQVKTALESAGWVIVDKDVKAAVLGGLVATLSKKSYVTMPMSELQLFGRSQDYGFAQADPLKVVATRHHFRIWKAPFQAGSHTVWIGAGTHDVGFDRDQRNNSVTHKIDPDTDLEREFIGRSLSDTGQVALLDYMVAKETVKEAKTAHGEAFHSDGRTLIIYLVATSPSTGQK